MAAPQTATRSISGSAKALLRVFFGLALALGCGDSLPESVGPAQEILVLADSTDWQALEEPLQDTFEKVVYTPQEEKTFSLQLGNVQDFDRYKHRRRKNLLVVSPIGAQHPTGEFLRNLLSPDVQQAIRNGSPAAVSWKEEAWAQDQLLITISGESLDNVVENIRMEADRLYRAVEEARNERIRELIYRYGERKDVTRELAEKYGWRVRVPFGYHIVEANPDSGFVVLTKEQPNRWLFVYWEDGIPPDRLTYDWCIQKRDEITRRFFDGDQIASGPVGTSQTPFAGKLAVELQGLWENEKNWTGGPFKSYAFVDVDLNRFFWIDVGVFAPNKYKEPYLRQVDLMARTFKLPPFSSEP